MTNFQQIINGDSGLTTRAKINAMLYALTEGEEGINAVWVLLRSLQEADRTLSDEEKADYARLLEFIGNANNYTDREVSKAYAYADAISGGAGGLIPSPSFNPSSYPTDKPVTLIALGAGTYTYFKDSSGHSIVISNDNSITVFFRAANASYWSYNTKVLDAQINGTVATALSILSGAYSIYQLTKNGTKIAPITTTDAVADSTRNEVLSTLLSQYEAFMSDDTHKFYTVTPYSVGDVCVKDRKLYQFKNNHQGAWSDADVDQISVLDFIYYVKAELIAYVDDLVYEYNVSLHHTRQAYDDFGNVTTTNTFNLVEAIACVPQKFQRGGIRITFIDSESGSWITYQLRKTSWSTNINDWKDTGNLDNAPDYFYLDENGDIWGHFAAGNSLSSATLTNEGDLIATYDEVYLNNDGDFVSNILSLQ